jgi:hypothetical protein
MIKYVTSVTSHHKCRRADIVECSGSPPLSYFDPAESGGVWRRWGIITGSPSSCRTVDGSDPCFDCDL